MKEDHRNYRRNFCSCEKKAWKKEKNIQACMGFKPLTSAIPVQRSTSWANKPTGSRSLNWFLTCAINPWKDYDDEVMNILWKSFTEYENCRVKSYIREDHRSYTCRCNFCSSKRKQIQACTGFEHLTPRHSSNWADKPSRSRSFKWFIIELLLLSYFK